MTEKEKLAAGLLYNGNDAELVEARKLSKILCKQFNSADYDDFELKNKIITRLFGKIGKNFWIEPDFFCDYGYNITIGDNFYVNHNCVILDCAPVTFGDNVFIAPNCGFYTAGHPLDFKTRNSGLEFAHPITVGSNVWIGGNVCVMPGVTIGEGSVIGAGSVVIRDIPAGVVAVGNPCRPVRKIQEES